MTSRGVLGAGTTKRMGIFLLKEPNGLFGFSAGLIIAVGIVLIKIG